jgi:hypothetical protein
MQKYLLYDSGCSTCSHLADVVHEAVGDSLALLSLRTPEAKGLLDEALPNGWRYAPYVVTVDGGSVRASTGLPATLQLGLWMGPVKAMRVWQAVTQEFAPKRRHFLKGSMASVFVVLFMARITAKAEAQNSCGGCVGYTRCQEYISSSCGCGTCCWSTFGYDKSEYYRLRYNPIYAGQSCRNCAYCGIGTTRITCGCPRK